MALTLRVAVLNTKTCEAFRPENCGSGGPILPGRTQGEIEFCLSLRPWRLCVKNLG